MNFTEGQKEKVLDLTQQRIEAFADKLSPSEREQLIRIDTRLFAKIWHAATVSVF